MSTKGKDPSQAAKSGTSPAKGASAYKRPLVRDIRAVLVGMPILMDGPRNEPVESGPVRSFLHTIHLLFVGIRRSHLTRMAAALSYRTMFGLVPVVVMVALALAAFTSETTQKAVVKQMLVYAGLNTLKVDAIGSTGIAIDRKLALESSEQGATPGADAKPESKPEPIQAPGAKPSSDAASDSANQASATAGSETQDSQTLDEWINAQASRIVTGIRQKIRLDLIGLVALGTLLYAAFSMLVEIEQAFNQIYNAPEGRSWVRRIVQYWTLLTLGPILLLASFAIQAYFQQSAEAHAANLVHNSAVIGAFKAILSFVSAAGVGMVLLLVIFATVPNTRVHPLPALLGALVAACLWELSKRGFTLYVSHATSSNSETSLSNLYGALAILPLFLIWIYISWLIILFGLQLAYSMQTFRQATARGLTLSVLSTLGLIEDAHPGGRPRLIDPSAMLVVLAAAAARFRQGKTSDHSQLAQTTGVDEQAVGEMLERLAGAGIVHRVAGADRFTAYSLARPPESIAADDVLRIADDLAGPLSGLERSNPISRLIGRARYEALAGKTLSDCIDTPCEIPTGSGGSPTGPAPGNAPATPSPA